MQLTGTRPFSTVKGVWHARLCLWFNKIIVIGKTLAIASQWKHPQSTHSGQVGVRLQRGVPIRGPAICPAYILRDLQTAVLCVCPTVQTEKLIMRIIDISMICVMSDILKVHSGNSTHYTIACTQLLMSQLPTQASKLPPKISCLCKLAFHGGTCTYPPTSSGFRPHMQMYSNLSDPSPPPPSPGSKSKIFLLHISTLSYSNISCSEAVVIP